MFPIKNVGTGCAVRLCFNILFFKVIRVLII